jgi:hypothetical protein
MHLFSRNHQPADDIISKSLTLSAIYSLDIHEATAILSIST